MSSNDIKGLLEGKKHPTDLIIILIWSIVTVIFVFILPDGNLVRIIFGIPILIFVPGYALVSALWPKNRRNQLTDLDDNFERVALSFGLSIVLVALVGLVLALTPAGINLATTLFTIFSLIIILSIVAYYRRMLLPIDKRYYIPFSIKSRDPEGSNSRISTAIVVTSFLISSFAVGYIILEPTEGEHYSEFYILDVNGTTDIYPINMIAGEPATVRVGVVCHEYDYTNYSILVGIENATTTEYIFDWNSSFNLTDDIKYERNFMLSHDSEFIDETSFSIQNPGRYKVVWQLSINGKETEYKIHSWVNVTT